jgi:hypothetical protein
MNHDPDSKHDPELAAKVVLGVCLAILAGIVLSFPLLWALS